MPPRGDIRTFKNEDLVLKVRADVDPSVWSEDKYEAFLDELCGHREYQKDAIRITLRYLLGGKYGSLRDLARENFAAKEELQQRYGTFAAMERHLQLPDQLSCSIDLATATGKSYVLYGIAMILLAEGTMDRVLVLCPSNTIDAGLMEKFRDLAGRADLRDALPEDSKLRTPTVINASETIVDGAICVENYHAILEHVKSSIRDSLKGNGARTAVLNDETHHVANASGTEARKWKSFLLDPEYGFRMVVGLSGTCYVGDDYFADVVARFSLREAIEQTWTKSVEYVAEMPSTNSDDEKWQIIYNRHKAWKRKLKARGIKPLTIVITKDIASCRAVTEQLQEFLEEWENISPDHAEAKVLPVTSHKDHQINVAKLKLVDQPSSKVEWIVSVAMLTEGWDVKNVFQIVPHEEKAFNSKLLIAQVLGRGLRKPLDWEGEQPLVTVFNHDAWSGRIKHLVNEVLEIERRLTSSVVPSSPYHFELHQLVYDRETDTREFTKTGERNFLEKGFIGLPSQVEAEDVSVEFERVTGERQSFKSKIEHKTHTVEEVAEEIYRRLGSIDDETADAENPKDRTNYRRKFPLKQLVKVVADSLKRAGIKSGRVTEANKQKFFQSLGPLQRHKAKRVTYRLTPKDLQTKSTKDRHSDSCSASDMRHGVKTVFYTPACEASLHEEQVEFFREINDDDGDFSGARSRIENPAHFKTPLNLVIATRNPERRFVRELCKSENASKIDAWLNNADSGFYPIEYATAHFERLNERLVKEGIPDRYRFTMLTPKNFSVFFTKLQDGTPGDFTSELDVVIKALSAP